MKKYEPRITVGELIEALQAHDPAKLVDFSTLDYYRLKSRSPTVVQVEFDQMVYRDDKGNVAVDNPE